MCYIECLCVVLCMFSCACICILMMAVFLCAGTVLEHGFIFLLLSDSMALAMEVWDGL